jgi:hypothetical protein
MTIPSGLCCAASAVVRVRHRSDLQTTLASPGCHCPVLQKPTLIRFSPMGKGPEFMAWEPERVVPDQRRLIAEHLASRYLVIDA